MSNQSNPQEVKQHLLEQGIQELNDEELEIVAGGDLKTEIAKDAGKVAKKGFSWKHAAISAAGSYFIPNLLFGGGGSSQSQSTTTPSQNPSK
jgi:hypothetical protein